MHDIPVGCAPPPPEHADMASENTPTIITKPTARSPREAFLLIASRSLEPHQGAHAFEGHPGLPSVTSTPSSARDNPIRSNDSRPFSAHATAVVARPEWAPVRGRRQAPSRRAPLLRLRDRWPVSGPPVSLWVGGLPHFDQMTVGIADVATDLVLVLLGRRQKLSSPCAPFGVHGLDVFDPNVEEA